MTEKPVFDAPLKKQTMAEQMAETIQTAILSGQLEAGAALPIEPDLAAQFGVSRAVVRDATRILMARGLVEVQHGRGVFVTPPDNPAFGEALLLVLRRVGASAWDVEQFEQVLFPEIIALAAAHATPDDVARLQQLVDDYLAAITHLHTHWWGQVAPPAELARLTDTYQRLMRAIFATTHNRVIEQLARPLLPLRNLRHWADDAGSSPDQMIAVETAYIRRLFGLITGGDPTLARTTTTQMMALPPEAIAAMQQTPVGEVVDIPIPLPVDLIGLSDL
jgi:GntR family transcriptional repressor for pyruvate dehydrogenase complex